MSEFIVHESDLITSVLRCWVLSCWVSRCGCCLCYIISFIWEGEVAPWLSVSVNTVTLSSVWCIDLSFSSTSSFQKLFNLFSDSPLGPKITSGFHVSVWARHAFICGSVSHPVSLVHLQSGSSARQRDGSDKMFITSYVELPQLPIL